MKEVESSKSMDSQSMFMVRYPHGAEIFVRVISIVVIVVSALMLLVYLGELGKPDAPVGMGISSSILIVLGVVLCVLSHFFIRFSIEVNGGILKVVPVFARKRELSVSEVAYLRPGTLNPTHGAAGITLVDQNNKVIVVVTVRSRQFWDFLRYLKSSRPDLFINDEQIQQLTAGQSSKSIPQLEFGVVETAVQRQTDALAHAKQFAGVGVEFLVIGLVLFAVLVISVWCAVGSVPGVAWLVAAMFFLICVGFAVCFTRLARKSKEKADGYIDSGQQTYILLMGSDYFWREYKVF